MTSTSDFRETGTSGVLLPDTRPKVRRAERVIRGIVWTPIYCANCAADGGMVPSENCNFAFYLCEKCAEKWAHLDGTYMVPDEVFWRNVNAEMLDKYRRILTPDELVDVLKDDSASLTKLCKDRLDFSKVQMT